MTHTHTNTSIMDNIETNYDILRDLVIIMNERLIVLFIFNCIFSIIMNGSILNPFISLIVSSTAATATITLSMIVITVENGNNKNNYKLCIFMALIQSYYYLFHQ